MKRTIALGAAWTVSAAAAVGLGFLAVSLVDASASPGTPSAVTAAPATGSADRPSASPTPTVAAAAPSATGEHATAGGTVFADCATGSPRLAGVPAAGWVVDDSNDPGEMEFTSGREKVEVHVVCVDGAPVFSLDDSSSTSRTASAPSSVPSSATAGADDSASPDDSTGRVGGGHGADDGPGDDSGGHGSDD